MVYKCDYVQIDSGIQRVERLTQTRYAKKDRGMRCNKHETGYTQIDRGAIKGCVA